ncbi:MAG: DUF3237 domain-containing protein [Pseudomonadota bacterium]
MTEIETEFLFEARVRLAEPIHVGPTPEGRRMIVNVKGGVFEGPRLRGEVVADTGADFARIRANGGGALDVRFLLRTDDGALIYAHWHGVMAFDEAERSYALDFDKPDDPSGAHRYYFRTAPRFETADERYGWLNDVLAVSRSRTGGGGVVHRIFKIV